MDKIIYFDYCAFVLIILLIISTLSRKMTQGKQNNFFMYLSILILINTVADIFSLNYDALGNGHNTAKYISHFVYLTVHMMIVPFYMTYLFSVTDVWHNLRRHRFFAFLMFTPLLIGFILMVLNPFTNKMFYLDSEGVYTRGEWFIILYVLAAIYMLIGLVHIFIHIRQFGRAQIVALLSVFISIAIVTVIQFLFPRIVLEMFAITAALIFLSMMLQRPEELLDTETGLGKLSAYYTNVRNASMNSKQMEIIMVNLVNFNVINNMLGYQGCTELLHMISERLIEFDKTNHLGSEIYYLGEGKFRIIMDNRKFDKTLDTAEQLCRGLRPGITFHEMTVNLVPNVCITKYPEDIDNVESLLSFGRDLNRIPFTGEVLLASNLYKKEYYDIKNDIDLIMEEALANNKFEVYYQPIYSVTEHRFNSAEALLRLKTEKYGFISPEIFIPAAEKSGAIHKIGKFVMDEVCKFISGSEFRKLGIDYIEVNLSVSQCMQVDLADDILHTINKYGIRTEQINLEITETAASYSQQTMMDNLNALQKAGVSFSLDDFGTGYSNMRRVASLPLNIVKLDKSFTNVEENSNLLIVLENTIHMIKDMNMKIVVEGIETEKMVQMFSDLQCEYIQGYFYSKPIPKEEFVKFIQENEASV